MTAALQDMLNSLCSRPSSAADCGRASIDTAAPEEAEDIKRNENFQYRTINPTEQIRLLRVQRTAFSHQYSLEKIDVSRLPDTAYIALSYKWGEATAPEDIHDIHIGHQTFWIRRSVYNFLKTEHEHQLIFIDAICLNQRDEYERKHQVSLMSDVYRHAQRVCAWLGTPSTEQRGDLRALSKCVNKAPTDKAWSEHAMAGLASICSGDYWRRLWIVQELLLAKDVQICYGEWTFDWKRIEALAKLPLHEQALAELDGLTWWDAWNFVPPHDFSSKQRVEAQCGNDWRSGLRLLHYRKIWLDQVHATGWPIHRAIEAFHSQQCRFKRDRVFALKGLLNDEGRDRVRVDYECSMRQVFVQAATLGLLAIQKELEGDEIRKERYPSDEYWSFCSDLRKTLGLTDHEAFEMDFQAAMRSATFCRRFVSHVHDCDTTGWSKTKVQQVKKNILKSFLTLRGDQSSEKNVKTLERRINRATSMRRLSTITTGLDPILSRCLTMSSCCLMGDVKLFGFRASVQQSWLKMTRWMRPV